MASSLTNRGIMRILEIGLRQEYNGGTVPSNFYIQLISDTAVPSVDTNTFSELTEIAAGNGYTAGGASVPVSSVGFPTLSEDDDENTASIYVQIVVWTASGGAIPASGDPARYAVITADPDSNTTLVDSREVLGVLDPGAEYSAPDGYALEINDIHLEGAHS